MKVKEIKAKSIIVKSNLPEGDYVINPYIGCQHGCVFCYARFMKRFTGHKEPWGSFVDVKINAHDLIKDKKYEKKYITLGSVTDCYQPLDKKYKLTRKILKKLIPLQPHIDILTKSDLVVRDIDLLKRFKHSMVAISLSSLDDKMRRELEPLAPSLDRRIKALKKLHRTGIYSVIFISPLLPEITNWKQIINKTRSFIDEYWFENLNLYPSIKDNIYRFLKRNKPELIKKYDKIYSKNSKYWYEIEKEIREFCDKNKIKFRIYFHHAAKTKTGNPRL